MKDHSTIKILGINFFKGEVTELLLLLKGGGLLVVPAAPALVSIKKDNQYYKSLLYADIIIADSGYMSLIWNFLHREKVTRISGLQLLIAFINSVEIQKESDVLLVDPGEKDSLLNMRYLQNHHFNLSKHVSHVAPMYKKDSVTDEILLAAIEQTKPKYILINLGGGTQEKLGAYLKKNLSYAPAIICTGAAIAFLTGSQAKIPSWADKSYFGWLYRCIEKPKLYIPRYFKAVKLLAFIIRYGKNSPYNYIDK